MPLPGSMYALDIEGGTIEDSGLGFSDGDADRPCMPIPGTLVPVPWDKDGIAQVQLTMHEHDGTPFFGDPRHLLANVLARFARLVADAGRGDRIRVLPGRSPNAMRTASRSRRAARSPAGASSARRSIRWRISTSTRRCSRRSIACAACRMCPPTSALAEYGPGQYEVNLAHAPGFAARLRPGAALQARREERGARARLRSHVPAQALPRHGRQRPAHSREPARCRRAATSSPRRIRWRARRCAT